MTPARPAAVSDPARPGVTARPPRALLLRPRHAAAEQHPLSPARVRDLLAAGAYARVPDPAVVVYRLEREGVRQTGVVVEVSLDDYRQGRIRRHEATQPEREQEIQRFAETAGIEPMPVMLTHSPRPRLRAVLDEIAGGEPAVRLSADGTEHTAWISADPERVRAVLDEIAVLPALYITDGHHRMAAAERYAARHPSSGDVALAAVFPSDEMRILGYHRCLPVPDGTSTAELLARIAAHPVITEVRECPPGTPPAPGSVSVRIDGRWFLLRLRAPADPDHVRDSLDVVVLNEELIPGIFGSAEVTCTCTRQETISLLPHPPGITEVMAVSDAGLLMPPKSTWFDPKAGVGLFVRELHR